MFRKILDIFNKIGRSHFYGDFFDSRFYISYLLSRKKLESILDVGCGVGVLLEAAPNCFKVGTDLSFESIKQAKKHNPKIEFIQSDAQFLPFKNEIFSTITAMHLFPVIHLHGGDWKLAVDEVKRVSNNHSTIFVTGANRTSRHFSKTHKLEDRKKYLRHVEQVKEFEDKFTVTLEGWGPHSRFIMYPFKIIYKIPDLINEKFGIEK